MTRPIAFRVVAFNTIGPPPGYFGGPLCLSMAMNGKDMAMNRHTVLPRAGKRHRMFQPADGRPFFAAQFVAVLTSVRTIAVMFGRG